MSSQLLQKSCWLPGTSLNSRSYKKSSHYDPYNVKYFGLISYLPDLINQKYFKTAMCCKIYCITLARWKLWCTGQLEEQILREWRHSKIFRSLKYGIQLKTKCWAWKLCQNIQLVLVVCAIFIYSNDDNGSRHNLGTLGRYSYDYNGG